MRVVPWAIVLAFGVRIAASFHPYTQTMGFNEAFYSLSARGFEPSTLTPVVCLQDACRPHLKLPPLASILLWALPDGEAWSRLPSLVAFAAVVLVAWKLRGQWIAVAMTVAPWLYWWMGRAQTDPLLVAAVALTVYGLRLNKKWAWAVGIMVGLLAKQTYVLAFPLFLRRDFWTLPNVSLGLVAAIPAGAWWLVQYQTHPTVFLEDWGFHAAGRVAGLGEAWPEVLALGFILGLGPLLWPLWRTHWRTELRLALTGALFLGFALIDAPLNHSYYTLPAIMISVLLLPPWETWGKWEKRTVLPASFLVGLVLLGVGGELDKPILRDALQDLPSQAFIQSSLWPQAEYYHADFQLDGEGCPVGPDRVLLCSFQQPGCSTIHVYRGYFDRLHLLHCPPLSGGQET